MKFAPLKKKFKIRELLSRLYCMAICVSFLKIRALVVHIGRTYKGL